MAVPITVPGDPSSPLTYTVPGSTAFIPRAASANFDGSGASADFLPTMKWVAQSGQVIGRYVAPQVAAGNSAEVSWAPFLGSAGVDAIRFDTQNLGDWLNVQTSDRGVPVTTDVATYPHPGIALIDGGGTSIVIGSQAGGDTHIDTSDEIHLSAINTFTNDVSDLALIGGSAQQLLGTDFKDVTFHGIDSSSLFQAITGQITLSADNPIRLINTGGTTSAVIYMAIIDGNYFSVFKDDLSKEWLRVGSGGIFMPHLPTVNPGVAGQLWRNGNIVTIV